MVDKIISPITPLGEIDKINELVDGVNNAGTVKKVNNTSPDGNGNVTISIPTVPLEGVQINGSDLTITNKKVNIPLAGTNTIGVAKANAAYGVYNNNGTLTISKATDSQVTGKSSQYRPLTPYNIDLAVKTGITTNTLTLTDTEKTAAKNWLGVSESSGGSSRNIGEIVASTIPLVDAGLHLLDGALIQGSGVYSTFVTYIAGLVSTYSDLFTTEVNWQSTVTQYGVCGKFVYNSTNNTVRLPKYNSKIYTGGGNAPVVGNGLTIGLTDGSKNSGLQSLGYTPGGIQVHPLTMSSSTYGSVIGSSGGYPQTFGNETLGLTTDATKSGIIADLSNITTSLDGYYYIVVATSTKTDIQVDIDEIATDLNSKVDKSDLQEVQCVVETYVNGTSWYRVYSDGWCEQGGAWGTSTGSWASASVTFLKAYKDTNYLLHVQGNWNTPSESSCNVTARSATGFTGSYANNLYSVMPSYWQACGYIEV